MNQDERVKEFLEKLTELSNEYGLEVTAEGTLLLHDYIESDWIEFGKNFFGSRYIRYED